MAVGTRDTNPKNKASTTENRGDQRELVVQTEGFSDVHDLTPDVQAFVEDREDGLVNVFVPGSTAGVTTLEYEQGCVRDLQRALDEIAPRDRPYKHNEKWGDGNGFSHLRAALLGPDVTLPYRGGTLRNGTWQQIVLVDCDNRSRNRSVLLTAL